MEYNPPVRSKGRKPRKSCGLELRSHLGQPCRAMLKEKDARRCYLTFEMRCRLSPPLHAYRKRDARHIPMAVPVKGKRKLSGISLTISKPALFSCVLPVLYCTTRYLLILDTRTLPFACHGIVFRSNKGYVSKPVLFFGATASSLTTLRSLGRP